MRLSAAAATCRERVPIHLATGHCLLHTHTPQASLYKFSRSFGFTETHWYFSSERWPLADTVRCAYVTVQRKQLKGDFPFVWSGCVVISVRSRCARAPYPSAVVSLWERKGVCEALKWEFHSSEVCQQSWNTNVWEGLMLLTQFR